MSIFGNPPYPLRSLGSRNFATFPVKADKQNSGDQTCARHQQRFRTTFQTHQPSSFVFVRLSLTTAREHGVVGTTYWFSADTIACTSKVPGRPPCVTLSTGAKTLSPDAIGPCGSRTGPLPQHGSHALKEPLVAAIATGLQVEAGVWDHWASRGGPGFVACSVTTLATSAPSNPT